MKTENDKREMTKEERKMERKRVLMIISLFLWGICLLVAGIGVWKAATSAPDSSQNQSSENDKSLLYLLMKLKSNPTTHI